MTLKTWLSLAIHFQITDSQPILLAIRVPCVHVPVANGRTSSICSYSSVPEEVWFTIELEVSARNVELSLRNLQNQEL